MSDIDPVHYGQLTAKVEHLENSVVELNKDIKTLLELANKSKGGLWVGMSLASFFGGLVTFVLTTIFGKH